MSALVLPRRLALTSANRFLCARIGVRVNGKDMGHEVTSYDVEKRTATLRDGRVLEGQVEPYWRSERL